MKAYWFIVKNSFKSSSQFFIDLVFAVANPILQVLGLLLFYSFVLNQQTGLDSSVVLYFLFVMMTSGVELFRFATDIGQDIESDYYLTIDKLPINPFVYYMLQNLGKNLAPITFLGIGVLPILIFYKVSAAIIILFYIATLLALVISYLIFFIVGAARFFTSALEPWLFGIIFQFLSGKLIPITFLPSQYFSLFLSFMPFIYASGAYATYISEGNLPGLLFGMGIGTLWCVILFVFATFLWNKGVSRYQELGE